MTRVPTYSEPGDGATTTLRDPDAAAADAAAVQEWRTEFAARIAASNMSHAAVARAADCSTTTVARAADVNRYPHHEPMLSTTAALSAAVGWPLTDAATVLAGPSGGANPRYVMFLWSAASLVGIVYGMSNELDVATQLRRTVRSLNGAS